MKCRVAAILLLPVMAQAQNNIDRFEVEAGIISTRNMEIRGFDQGNTTQDWSKSGPIARLEYWRVNESSWNYGLVIQPLSLKYKDTFKSDLDVKGKAFKSGNSATLDYQFPTVRFSANKPIYQGDDGSYVRAGGSAVVRYAKVGLSASGQSFTDTNLILIPLFNIEASQPLSQEYSFFSRSDFLPGIDGNIFLDGLYDVYFGIRKKIDKTKDLDIGVRLFFGGYDPKKADDYANKIFFNSLVVRYGF